VRRVCKAIVTKTLVGIRPKAKGYWDTADRRPKSVTLCVLESYYNEHKESTRKSYEQRITWKHLLRFVNGKRLLLLSRSILQDSWKSVFSPLRVNFISLHIHQVLKCRVKPTLMSG
jgi:hypothetical protein